ncbi:MAG: hypothetical protein ACOC3E_00045 [Cyanobacteriota bacterium]
MSEEVVQWLTEIRTLKQQLQQARREQEEASKNEANWRKLYSTEAQQRRTEAQLAQEQIEALKLELEKLNHGATRPKASTPEAKAALEQELAGLETVEALRAKLIEVIEERDRTLNALKTEQENHAKTRKSLTAVISDTIDQLKTTQKVSTQPLNANNDQT